jgi:hypothetical protein
MASAEIKTNQSQFRVRPGLLVLFAAILVWAVGEITHVAASLAMGPVSARRAILLLATTSTAFGWFFLCKDPDPNGSRRKWIAIGTSLVLTLSIPAYALYAVIPLKFILPFRLLSTIADVLVRWREGVAILAWIAPFFGRGRSRIAFVLAGTLMLFVWNATNVRGTGVF